MFYRTLIILLVLSLSCSISALSVYEPIKIDGYATENDWQDLDVQVLVEQKDDSNCQVSFALVTTFYDRTSSSIYLAFKVITQGTKLSNETFHGVMVNVDNSGFVNINRHGISEYDSFLYAFEAAVSEYNPTDYCVEMRIGIKAGLDTLGSIEVRLVDADDVCSNSYFVDLPPLYPDEETTVCSEPDITTAVRKTTAKYTESITTTQTEKTTEKRTTAVITTRERTTWVKPTEETAYPEKTKPPKTTKQKKSEKSETEKTKTKKTKAQVQTVYISVIESSVSSVAESFADSNPVAETSSVTSMKYNEYKEIRFAAIAALAVVAFGICIMVNVKGSKN